jgi:hypothetical protein
MEAYANIFNNLDRPLFSSSISKNGITAFYGRSLSKFKYGLAEGMNPCSNGTTLKFSS